LRHRLLVTAASVLSVLSTPCAAQVMGSVDLSSALGRTASGPWLRESRFAPELRLTNASGYLRIGGLVAERAGNISLRNATVDGSVASPVIGLFRLSLAANDASLSAALSARVQSSGLWLGVDRAHDAASSSSSPTGHLVAGAWHVMRNVVMSVTTQSRLDGSNALRISSRQLSFLDSTYDDTSGWQRYTIYRTVTDTTKASMRRALAAVEARVDWSAGRVAIGAALSRVPSLDTRSTGRDSTGIDTDSARSRAMLWGRITAAVQLNARVAIVASGGTLPPTDYRVGTSRFATLGFRLTHAALPREPLPAPVRPVATAFAVRALSDGVYRVTVRVPLARTVEISGDFNQWSPVSLAQTSTDTWEITLPMSPGTHRVNVRVDGDRWMPPPGLPSVDDDFNGRVGIVVVR
jgi:hypothetical protein